MIAHSLASETAVDEGVFGPEIVVGTATGEVQLRWLDGRIFGNVPQHPITNAYLVHLTAPVVVVSQGVQPDDAPKVAMRMRAQLGLADIPVLFNQGIFKGGPGTRVLAHHSGTWPSRELARAEAYVLAQRALVEAKKLTIQLGTEEFHFELRVRQLANSGFRTDIIDSE